MTNSQPMTEEFVLKMSRLCQPVTPDGKTVKVEIYGDGADKWLLEVVDEEGMASLIGRPSAEQY